jgi:hypothetical protein
MLDAPAIGEQRQQALGQEERPLSWIFSNWSNCASLVSLNGTSADPGVVHQEVQLLATELLQGVAQALDEGGEARTVTDIQLQHGGAYTGRLQRGGHGLGLVGLAVVSADDVDAAGGQVLAVLRLRLRLAPVIRAILRVMSVTSWAMAVTDRLLIGRWLLNPANRKYCSSFQDK